RPLRGRRPVRRGPVPAPLASGNSGRSRQPSPDQLFSAPTGRPPRSCLDERVSRRENPPSSREILARRAARVALLPRARPPRPRRGALLEALRRSCSCVKRQQRARCQIGSTALEQVRAPSALPRGPRPGRDTTTPPLG